MTNIFAGIAAGAERGRATALARKKLKVAQTKENRLQATANLDEWESASNYQDGIWELTQGDGPVNIDEISGKMKIGKAMYGDSFYIDGADLLMDLHATPAELESFIGTGASDADKKRLKQYTDIYEGGDIELPEGVTRVSNDKYHTTISHQTKAYNTNISEKDFFERHPEYANKKKARAGELKNLHGFMSAEAQQKHQMSWEMDKMEFMEAKQTNMELGKHGQEWRAAIADGFSKNLEPFSNDPETIGKWLIGAQKAGAESGFSQDFINDSLAPYYEQGKIMRAKYMAKIKGQEDEQQAIERWNTSLRLTGSAVNAELARHAGARDVNLGMDGNFKANFEGAEMEKYKAWTQAARPYIIAGLSAPEVLEQVIGDPVMKYPDVSFEGEKIPIDRMPQIVKEIENIDGYVYYNEVFIDPVNKTRYPASDLIQRWLSWVEKNQPTSPFITGIPYGG